jgi:signal transduction histidine kinase
LGLAGFRNSAGVIRAAPWEAQLVETSLNSDLLDALSELSAVSFRYTDRREALERIADLGRKLMQSQAFVVTRIDSESGTLDVQALSTSDDAREPGMTLRKMLLTPSPSGDPFNFQLCGRGQPTAVYGLHAGERVHSDSGTSSCYDLFSVLNHPLYLNDNPIGYVSHFSIGEHPFGQLDRKLLEIIAHHAVNLIEASELTTQGTKLAKLLGVLQGLNEMQDTGPLVRLALEGGFGVLGCNYGSVRLFDRRTGNLELRRAEPRAKVALSIDHGTGITGLALKEQKPQRIADVTLTRWASVYLPLWDRTLRSELAVPIIMSNAQVRIGTEISTASKVLGVLNFESPVINAFSHFDEECADALARHLARVMEHIEFERKLKALQKVQREIVGRRDWESIIEIVLEGIVKTLGYEYVNISLVFPEENTIRTAYVRGLSESDQEEFKRIAVHRLDSNDIQAFVVRNKTIEVPPPDDSRYDPMIFERFRHVASIRVFVPMLSSDNLVIGTVEAGYAREYREHIYERDVQILKGFVDYATMALEQRRRGQIDRISHELSAPLAALRANASVLQRRWKELSEQRIQRQFDDMLTDSEVLVFQVKQLEYMLGSGATPSAFSARKTEPVLLFRDIIIKTIHQLRPLVTEQGLDPLRVDYETESIHRVKQIYSDKTKLSQVFFNLFLNSIKYFSTPDTFRILIGAEETKEHFVIRFRDWGIGVPEGLEEKIFEDGYRAPTALRKNVSGSGFGLTIARRLMRDLGGDLRLVCNRSPTEFQVLLPKRSKP